MINSRSLILAAAASSLLWSVAAQAAESMSAVAQLRPTEGSEVTGIVTFDQTEDGVHVIATVEGLTAGKHGFHIHQWGNCSSADGASAGDHYNPEESDHAGPEAGTQHIGDLGNITAADNGNGIYEAVLPFLTLTGEHSIIGRGVIIHAGEDDLTSQPGGDAGDRQACGVIGIKES